ncbi:hypothetical protein Tsubulata_003007, partial [Turnera subulata]
KQFMAKLIELQSSQDSNGDEAGLVGNGSFGGSLPTNSYWEQKFENQVQKTAMMEEKLMAATTRLDEMEKLIRSLHIPPGFQQRIGGTDTEAIEKDTDKSSSEDGGSEHEET